jgi:hypothetical protein
MKISGSIISFLSGAFLFGSVSPTNGANAEKPSSIHDILDKHGPIQRGQGYTTVSPFHEIVTPSISSFILINAPFFSW